MALAALMITRTIMTTTDEAQYVWFALFVVLCAAVAFADSDTQILTAGCVIVATVAPIIVPFIVVTRLILHLRLAHNKKETSLGLPFESMYPDTPQHKDESTAPVCDYKICF